jgi:hypothetical protein
MALRRMRGGGTVHLATNSMPQRTTGWWLVAQVETLRGSSARSLNKSRAANSTSAQFRPTGVMRPLESDAGLA